MLNDSSFLPDSSSRKKNSLEKDPSFDQENKNEEEKVDPENVEEDIEVIKKKIKEIHGADSEMESRVLYDYLEKIFYRRYVLHNQDDKECSEDTKMIEIMKFFQKELEEFVMRGDRDSLDSHMKQFSNLADKTAVLFGRHSEIIKSRRFRYEAAFTLFVASSYFEVNSPNFKFMLSKVVDLRGPEHVRDRLGALEDGDKEKIFQKISELVSLVQKEDDELAKNIFKDGEKKVFSGVRGELFRKVYDIIFQFGEELKNPEKIDKHRVEKLLINLEQSRVDIDLISSLLIAAKKEGQLENVEDIKGVDFEEVGGDELMENKELEDRLTNMYRANNSHKSKDDLDRLMDDFEEHKRYSPKFNLVYFNENGEDKKSLENLVGFMRSSQFDGQKELGENERYLGAMNIDPLLQRFYFGENFLREVIAKELENGAKKLIAHVPENGPSYKAAKAFGFKDVDQEGEYKDDNGNVLAKRIRIEFEK